MPKPPKRFNVAGPCDLRFHYLLPPLPRLRQVQRHIEEGDYIWLHGLQPFGKTTFLRHLAHHLTASDQFAALYLSCEVAEAAGDDHLGAQEAIVRQLVTRANADLPETLRPTLPTNFTAADLLSDFLEGQISREYSASTRRLDLLITWPWTDTTGKRQTQQEALELKVWRDGRPDPLPEGLRQLDGYLDRLSLDTGVLILFDRRKDAPSLEARVREEQATSPKGRTIRVLRA